MEIGPCRPVPLGMVEVEDALSNRLLRDVGVSAEDMRAALHAAPGSVSGRVAGVARGRGKD